MRRIALTFLFVAGLATCGGGGAEAETEKLAAAASNAWLASRRTVTLSERIARVREAVAAHEALEKHAGAARARENVARYARAELDQATNVQAAAPCAEAPRHACLIAEAEKRVKRGDPREAIQVSILLRASGDRRFADRLKAIIAEIPAMSETIGIPSELRAANADDLLDAFAKAMAGRSGNEDAAAVALYFRRDRGGYAAMLDKMRAARSLDEIRAAAIAEQTAIRRCSGKRLRKPWTSPRPWARLV